MFKKMNNKSYLYKFSMGFLSFRTLTMLLSALVMILVGCQKDKDVDDYKRERFLRDFSRIKAAEGEYRGYLLSKKTGESLGAFSVKLTVSSKVLDGTDGSKASEQPVLKTNLICLNENQLELSASNSFFDPDSNSYVSEITVQRGSGSTGGTGGGGGSGGATTPPNSSGSTPTGAITITVRGNLQGDKLVGSLEVNGYDKDKYGGDFDLARNGKALDELNKDKKPAAGYLFAQLNYEGSTTFSNGKVKKVLMSVLKPKTTSEEDFLSLLVPLVPVSISFNYGNAAVFPFIVSSYLDQRTGTLTGQLPSISGSNGTVLNILQSVVCKPSEGTDNKNLTCAHTTFKSVDAPVAISSLRPNKGRVREPAPDNPNDRRMENKNYFGQANVGAPGSPDQREMVLKVTRPAKFRMDELIDLFYPIPEAYLEVSLMTKNETAIIDFGNQVRWDKVNRTLEGVNSRPSGTVPVTTRIQCANFGFDTKSYSFRCHYQSSLRVNEITIDFSSKL